MKIEVDIIEGQLRNLLETWGAKNVLTILSLELNRRAEEERYQDERVENKIAAGLIKEAISNF